MSITFDKPQLPPNGTCIDIKDGKIVVPNDPIISFIEGDGIGSDITKAMQKVVNAAVEKAYSGEKKIIWFEIFAGDKAQEKYGEVLPEDTLKAIPYYHVAIKGPLTTPVGGGFRSLNVTMRQKLDLFSCIRPVKHYKGVPSPVKHPEKIKMVVFRENTEDVYAGIEWAQGTKEAKKIIKFLKDEYNIEVRSDSGIGIKPISITGTKRLVRMAIQYAIERGRKSVTLMHKGNIMKYTEGSFKEWGYELAKEEFADVVIRESDWDGKELPEGKILIKDRIADSMFQQILTRPDEYDIIATPNLNGDYISDALAAQVGGLGMAPGANLNNEIGLFEATHGTAPKYANKNMINPGSLILSAVMMLEHLGWWQAAKLIENGVERTILNKTVTYDLERQMEDAIKLGTNEYADKIVENMAG